MVWHDQQDRWNFAANSVFAKAHLLRRVLQRHRVGADGSLMCRSCPSKNCQIMRLLTKTSIENPLRLRRLKAIQSSRRVNHCFSLICAGAGESNPKTRRSADFERSEE